MNCPHCGHELKHISTEKRRIFWKIQVIKKIKESTGLDLLSAKKLCEEIEEMSIIKDTFIKGWCECCGKWWKRNTSWEVM